MERLDLEIDQPFDAAAVQTLVIGGSEYADNLRTAGTSLCSTRRRIDPGPDAAATSASGQSAADADFDRLSLWAYETLGNPSPPSQMDASQGCIDPDGQAQWRDGCQIRVYYDGQVQLGRSGADFRVTLPETFTGDLVLGTEDNDADPDYQDRGNVCVEGLAGSGEIELGAGQAFVSLAADLNPFPICASEDIQACEEAGWISSCPCLALAGVGNSLVVRGGMVERPTPR